MSWGLEMWVASAVDCHNSSMYRVAMFKIHFHCTAKIKWHFHHVTFTSAIVLFFEGTISNSNHSCYNSKTNANEHSCMHTHPHITIIYSILWGLRFCCYAAVLRISGQSTMLPTHSTQRFSQQCCWRFKYSGMLYCAVGQVYHDL